MPVQYAIYKQSKHQVIKPRVTSSWIKTVARKHKRDIGDIQYIICTDDELLQINIDYLKHDYYTDIITFDYSEGRTLSGDIFVSIDRIAENATKLGVLLNDEWHRVIIHGILHLCGFKDKSANDAKIMRENEEKALKMRSISLKKKWKKLNKKYISLFKILWLQDIQSKI
jgi:probable rRNA maturation factor